MWLKILLLLLYLVFLFILSRILEVASWFQDTEKLLTSFVALDPIKLSVKNLKQILDNRGISYSGVLEKNELVDLVESSGQATGQELVEDSTPSKGVNVNDKFTCGSHFYEEVEDTKDSAWLVQVVNHEKDRPLLSDAVWGEVMSKVSKFGIRTGQYKCSRDRRLCQRKGWTSSRLILALPQGNKAKEDVVMYEYLQSSSSLPIMQWVRKHLSSRVKTIASDEELRRWTEYSGSRPKAAVRIIFFSVLQSCPMFLSALAIKFNGRVDFAVVDTSKDKVNYRKYVKASPSYLVVTPEKSFTYGSKKGESLNFRSMEIFLRTFVPEMNDALCWTLIIVNALATFELFVVHLPLWKHLVLYFLCMIKYNAVLIILWMLISTLYSVPLMVSITSGLLKCLRIISSSAVATVVRNDYKIFYSYPFILATFVAFALAAGYVIKKYSLVDLTQNVEFLSHNWWVQPLRERYQLGGTATYFLRRFPYPTNPQHPDPTLDLEDGVDLLIERLAVPNLWLQPVISLDYLKELPVWEYQGWSKGEDSMSPSEASDEESANVSPASVEESVPKSDAPVPEAQPLLESCPEKCKSSPDPDDSERNPRPLVSSIDLSTARVEPKSSGRSNSPKGMIELRECSICLEEYRYQEFLCGLPCGHNFHFHCIMNWLTTDKHHLCPICRWPSYKRKDINQHPHSL